MRAAQFKQSTNFLNRPRISGRIYVMDDLLYNIMKADFVLTNSSNDRDQ